MGLRPPVARLVLSAALASVALSGCSTSDRIAGITPPPGDQSRYPGFDIAIYPGDATMAAWRFPTSPYYWVGYYLDAPCHRDATWMGKRAGVTSLGWGTLLIYVGQQDWARIPNEVLAARWTVLGNDRPAPFTARTSALTVTCSASLLTSDQGRLEAADAVAKALSEGFPVGSAIFLDIEYVTSVAPPLADYVAAWVTAVLADGRYRPAIYAAKSNAPAIYSVVTAAFTAAGHSETPKFWIAGSGGFSTNSHPTDVGLSYAAIWQGRFDVSETWGGSTRVIDVNVATTASPSAAAHP